MKRRPILFAWLLLAPLTATGSTATPGTTPPTPCQAAFGFESFRLGGKFGKHLEAMTKGNLLQLDMEKDFLGPFRQRKTPNPRYIGLGKTLDAGVHFAALTGDPEITAWKDKWIAETIGTIDPDGYIGISPKGSPYEWSKFGFHERGPIILALANDYRFFGKAQSLEAARRIADAMLAEWPKDMNSPEKLLLWTVEYPLIRLSEVSGDPKYTEFVRTRFFPGDKLDKQWAPTTQRMDGHVYGWCDNAINMLDLHRHHPNPALTAAPPLMIAWLKDGGSVPPGEFCETERWTRGQATRNKSAEPETSEPLLPTKVGESCAKFYVIQLLDRLNRTKPEVFNSDVIERTFYNGLFAAMSPDGRQLCYALSIEGTRSYWNLDTYCCPGNLRRAFAYLPYYFYTLGEGRITVNLYGESAARLRLPEDRTLTLTQETDYPASGKIRFRVEPSAPLRQTLAFRIPAWCRKPAALLNGEPVAEVPKPGNFLTIDREWVPGDTVELDFPMEWRWIGGIRTQKGKAALARGPVVYSLDPVASGLDYVDVAKKVRFVEEDAAHEAAYGRLQQITLDPASVSGPRLGAEGATAEVRGWLGRPGESPEKTFVFRTFDQPEGRKIYFQLSQPEVAMKDELFGAALHEDTVSPARWAKIKAAIKEKKLGDFSFADLKDALKITPLFGAHESETAEGEIGGHAAWISAVSPSDAPRRMGFRVRDPRFTDGAAPKLEVTVVYLDLGTAKLTLQYDAVTPGATEKPDKKGTTQKAGEIALGNSGQIMAKTFSLEGARLGQGVSPDKVDFSLISDAPLDFVVFGVFLQAKDTGKAN